VPMGISNLRALSGVVLAAFALFASAASAEPLDGQVRLSHVGPDGDKSFSAANSAAAYDSDAGRHLVVWSMENVADNKWDVYGRFVDGAGQPAGGQFEIARSRGAGDVGGGAFDPRVVYNPKRHEFFVVWCADDSSVDDDYEIWGQRLGTSGDLLGGRILISTMGLGSKDYNAVYPQLAYNSRRDEYFVVYWGRNSSMPDRAEDVWARRVTGSGQPIASDVRVSSTRNRASWSTVAYNSVDDEYLVAFIGNDEDDPDKQRAFVQRLTGDAALVGPNRRIQTSEESHKPAVAYNADRNEYLVAWPSTTPQDTEIRAQRIAASGEETGRDDVQISAMGPVGAPAYATAVDVGVGYSPTSRQYVVTWIGDDTENGLVDNELEVFAQSLDEDLGELGSDDVPVSSMGPDGSTQYGVRLREMLTGPVSWDSRQDQFLVVYEGDDDTPPLVDDEIEVFGRRFSPYHAPAGPPGPETPPPPPPPPGPDCPSVLVPAPDRNRDGCPDATAITKRFQVAFTFRGGRVERVRVSGVRRRGRVAIVCLRGCGRKGRTLGRATQRKRKGPVKLSLRRVRLQRVARLEVRVGQPRRVRRYLQFRIKPRAPAVQRVAEGCMWPTLAKRVAC
jgi:hypothetical protein